MHLLLIGPRGSGKSTIGRTLAARTGRPFADLDDHARQRFGDMRIADIWRVHGEPAWRNAEADAFSALLGDASARDRVIALGGGAPMIAAVQEQMTHARRIDTARIVYLTCDPTELERRVERDAATSADRPPLITDAAQAGDPVHEIRTVIARRDSTYRMLADAIVDVTTCTIDEAANRVAHAVGLDRDTRHDPTQ